MFIFQKQENFSLIYAGLWCGGLRMEVGFPAFYLGLHTSHLRQECHNSKFGIFELLLYEEAFANALLTGTVSQRV